MSARWTASVLTGVLLLAGTAHATPDWRDATRVATAVAALQDSLGRLGDPPAVPDLVAGLAHALTIDMARPVTAAVSLAPPSGRPGLVEPGDLQIALTQLSIQEGTNNQIRVMQGQGGRRDAIFLRDGVATLQQVVEQAAYQGLNGITTVDGVVRLTRPLIVWPGAALILQPGDGIEMRAETGAFLLSFGRIDLRGAEVRAAGYDATPEAFRPFILTSGQGTLVAKDGRFSGLGMPGADPFGGIVVSTQGLFAPEVPPALHGNRFDDLGSVTLRGVDGSVIENNLFRKARGTALVLVGVRDTRVSGNTLLGTQGGAGIRVAHVAGRVRLSGNLVAAGARNGMTLTGSSGRIALAGNVVLGNGGSGIAAHRTQCLRLDGNIVLHSGAAGLRLTETGETMVQGNALVLNKAAALSVNGQQAGHRVTLAGNLFAANRVGLTGAQIGDVALLGNDLHAQLPRLFDGEFSQHLPAYLTADQIEGARLYRVSASGSAGPADFTDTCEKE